MIVRIYHECEVGIEKSVPRITILASLVMPIGNPRYGFFYHTLTRIIDSFSCSPLNMSFYIGKTCKRLPENHENAEMRHGEVI